MSFPTALSVRLVAAIIAGTVLEPGGELRVLRVTPSSEAAPTASITVTFDRPVAGSLDRTVDPKAIFSVAPATPGTLDWRDPVTLRFRPAAPLVPEHVLYRHHRRPLRGDGRQQTSRVVLLLVSRSRSSRSDRLASRTGSAWAVPGARGAIRPRRGCSGRFVHLESLDLSRARQAMHGSRGDPSRTWRDNGR